MFDIITALRNNRLKLASAERLQKAVNAGMPDGALARLREDYLSDLIDECVAAELFGEHEAKRFRRVPIPVVPFGKRGIRLAVDNDDGPRAA